MATGRSTWRSAAGALLAAIALRAVPAAAHRSTPAGATAGLSLPSVSHGQMVVLDSFRGAILDLARNQYPTDAAMRRLQSFVDLQSFACLWGLVPGGVTDEQSPFNECTHATLAGVRALLLHLETMPGDRSAVRALRGRIDEGMLEHRASLVVCRFGDETFDTAQVVVPRASDLLFDVPSLAALTALALCSLLGGAGIAAFKRELAGSVAFSRGRRRRRP